jgi:hypothetical protein
VAVVRDPEKNRMIEFTSASKPWRDTRFKPSEKDLLALGP